MKFDNELRAKPFKLFIDTVRIKSTDHLIEASVTKDEAGGSSIAEINQNGIILNDYPLKTYYDKLYDLTRFTTLDHKGLATLLFRLYNKSEKSPISGSQLIEAFKIICYNSLFDTAPFEYQKILMSYGIYGYKTESDKYYLLISALNPKLMEYSSGLSISRRSNSRSQVDAK